MSQMWSYALAAVGIGGLMLATRWPKVGWWFSLAAQTAWMTYAIVTRQYGFVISVLGHSVAYIVHLRRAYKLDVTSVEARGVTEQGN